MKIAPALLRIVLALAPITPAVMMVLTPTAAEASDIDQVVEEISHLIIQGKITEAVGAISTYFWGGGNMETLFGLIERRIAEGKHKEEATKALKAVYEKLPSRMLPTVNLPVAPFVILPPDDALTPAAGRGGKNDEA